MSHIRTLVFVLLSLFYLSASIAEEAAPAASESTETSPNAGKPATEPEEEPECD